MKMNSGTFLVATLAGLCASGAARAQTDLSRAYQAELLADAEGRLNLQGAAGAAGWEKGKFYISDATGDNTLNIGGSEQFRYEANFRRDVPAGDEDFTHGFENRRTRLRAYGSIFEKPLTYKIEVDFSRNGGGAMLLDAEGKYTWSNGAAVRWGQFKAPLMREELISDWYQLAVERSIYNNVFSITRTQGVELSWVGSAFRFAGMVNDGANALNTTFDSAAEADIGLTGRGEWMWSGGDWKRFDDFCSWNDADTFAGLSGVAVHWQTGGSTGAAGGAATADMDIFQITADTQIEGRGWNAFASATYRTVDAAGAPELNVWGVLVQGGLFVSNQVEIFARYDVVVPDTDAGADEPFNTVTVGATYFVSPKSHAARIGAEVLYFINDTPTSASVITPTSGSNLFPDTKGDQIGFMLQFQFIF